MSELDPAVLTFRTQLQKLAETGDPSVFSDPQLEAAGATAHAFDLRTCKWNTINVEDAPTAGTERLRGLGQKNEADQSRSNSGAGDTAKAVANEPQCEHHPGRDTARQRVSRPSNAASSRLPLWVDLMIWRSARRELPGSFADLAPLRLRSTTHTVTANCRGGSHELRSDQLQDDHTPAVG